MDYRELPTYIWLGRNYQHWYRDCNRLFIELFGEEEVPLVTQLFAATSINTAMKSNITLFKRAYHEHKNGLPISNYLPNIQKQLERLRNGQELSGRKIRSFAAAMAGDVNAVVMDIWALRAFGVDRQYVRNTGAHAGKVRSGGATDRQYTLIENYVREQAAKMGLLPYEVSAMIWAGARMYHNGERDNSYEAILRSEFCNLFSGLSGEIEPVSEETAMGLANTMERFNAVQESLILHNV